MAIPNSSTFFSLLDFLRSNTQLQNSLQARDKITGQYLYSFNYVYKGVSPSNSSAYYLKADFVYVNKQLYDEASDDISILVEVHQLGSSSPQYKISKITYY